MGTNGAQALFRKKQPTSQQFVAALEGEVTAEKWRKGRKPAWCVVEVSYQDLENPGLNPHLCHGNLLSDLGLVTYSLSDLPCMVAVRIKWRII